MTGDPQNEASSGRRPGHDGNVERLSREGLRTKARTAIFAILIGIVVVTSVLPMAWWTAKALGLW